MLSYTGPLEVWPTMVLPGGKKRKVGFAGVRPPAPPPPPPPTLATVKGEEGVPRPLMLLPLV
jgi:hypothetical protein